MSRFVRAAFLTLAAAGSLAAQQLTLGTTTVNPGQNATLSVSLNSQGQSVAAVQFTLNYDTTNLAPQLSTTASITSGSPTITVTSATGIVPGYLASVAANGLGLNSGTTVLSVVGNTVTLSKNATATNASANLIFSALTVALNADDAGNGYAVSQNRVSNGLTVLIANAGGGALLNDGDLLDLTIRVPSGATPATYPITFSNVSGSDPSAVPLTVTTVPGSVTVNQLAQTITFGALANQTFNASPITVSATASSGLAVSFSSTTTGVCTTNGTNGATVTFVALGTCTIAANQSGNATYSAALPVNQSFTVTQGSQTITFGALGNQTFNASPITVSATASSGLTVSFASTTGGVCTTSGTNGAIVTFVTTGTCTISASQGGTTNFAAAPSVSQGFTITQGSQTITFNALGNQTFNASPITVSATASSALTVSFSSTTPLVCTTGSTNGATVTFVATGTCTISASQGGNGNFAAATAVSQSFTIGQGSQTITFNAIASQPFNASPFTVSATASSTLPVTFTSTTTGVCTTGGTNGAAVTFLTTGTCTISASQGGNGNFTAASPVSQSFTIAAASQTITFGALANQSFTASPITVSATASSTLTVSFTSNTTGVCTTSGTNGATVTFLTTGTCTIAANQGGNGNFAPAQTVTQGFSITAASQTITFGALANQPFTASPITVSATASSALAVAFTSNTPLVCTTGGTNGATVTFVAAGTCTIAANQSGSNNFAAALQVTQGFTINPGSQTITFAALGNQPFTASPITVSATASSTLAVTFTSTTAGVCTTSGTNGAIVTFVGVGTCTIAANQSGNGNFSAAPQVTQGFSITQGAQTITFGALANQPFTASPITVSATASSTLTVGFSSTTAGVCTTSGANGSIVTFVAVGTCTISASQGGNTNFAAATPVSQSFTIGQGSQTITFNAIASQPFNASPFTVSAAASSTLAVTFTSTTTGVCTTGGLNGSAVTFVTLGTCTIAANQPGNNNFTPASQVTQSFTVAAASQTITFGALGSQPLSASPITVSATASSALAVTFTSTTTAVCTTGGTNGATVTFVTLGTCTIAANQAGNANFAAAPQVTQGFTITQGAQTITFGALGNKLFTASPITVSATASSTLTVTFSSTTAAVCTTGGTNGATVTFVAVGTCTIAANQAGNANYLAAPQVTQGFTITQGAQTITFGALGNQVFTASPITVSATASSTLAVSFTSTTLAVCTTGGANGATVTFVGVGTCTIAANQAGNANYSAAPQVTQGFTITQGAQTITFGALGNQTFNASPITVSATASSNLAVSFTSTTAGVCTTGGVNGATVTFVALGTCTIAANQAGNANFTTAPQVTQSFTVAQGSQTITFVAPGNVAIGSGPIAVTATATSGLAVSFTSTTAGVCTTGGANGATVTIVSLGTCTIVASQAGNANFTAAASVTQSFSVFTISISGPASLPSGTVTFPYSAIVTATGGTGVYTWTATGLPPGLTINSVTGGIGGSPTTVTGSPFSVQVTVTDTSRNSARMTYAIVVNPAPPIPPALTLSGPFVLPEAILNVPYQTLVSATGGVVPYTWSATGLPAGLSINAATGTISGTPTASTNGVLNVHITVTDNNNSTANAGYSLIVSNVLTVAAPASLPTGTVPVAYPATAMMGGGGVQPYTWLATGLPPGLSIGFTTGVITGVPTSSAGSPYNVQVTVIDSTGAKATRNYALTVNSQLSISGPASLPVATLYVAYPSTTVTATGGTGPYTWFATGLPLGLNIGNTTGVISGTTAMSVGSPFTVQVTVTDQNLSQASMTYTLTVNQPPVTLPLIAGVSNAAGGQATLAPNTWVSIYGSNFAAPNFTDTWSSTIVNGKLPIVLDGVSVMVGGQAAYVSYLSATQINILLPNVTFGSLPLIVTTPAGASVSFSVTSQQYSPAFFPWPSNQPVATHADFSFAAAAGTFTGITTIPAKPGEVIILWGTGFGPTNPVAPFGVTIPTTTMFSTAVPATATIGGLAATVSGVALASGYGGLFQMAITVPATLANGTYPVIASIGGSSTPTLTLTVHN